MHCPFCNNEDTQVKDSRPAEEGHSIRRRRLCTACEGRFTTFERVQLRELMVRKKTGRVVPFDREKLMQSVQISLRKRPVDGDTIEQLVSGIVRTLEQRGEAEVPTDTIGQHVMDALATVDGVAYTRYASVYKNFREVEDFERFIGEEKLSETTDGDA